MSYQQEALGLSEQIRKTWQAFECSGVPAEELEEVALLQSLL